MASNNTPAAVKAGYWYCNSEFPVANIDSSLFTHLFAAFADVNSTSYEVTFPNGFVQQFEQFTELVRAKNPDVQTLLSIGGGRSSPSTFASMTRLAANREAFIDSSLQLARDNKFDGLSLNWQYPSTIEEMTNLGKFLGRLRAKAGDQLLLTAAVFYSSDYTTSVTYPIQEILTNLNWINVISYDIYTPKSSPNLTGPPAPLKNLKCPQLSVDAGISAWMNAGMEAKQLVLGLEFHGRSWLLVNANDDELFAPARGEADIDPISYQAIKKMNPTPTPVIVPTYDTAFFTAGTTRVGYDDDNIISRKVTYAKKTKGLLGYVAWHVADDTADWTLSNKASDTWDAAN